MPDYRKMAEELFLAPARGWLSQAPKAPPSMGLLGQIHNAIDPVNVLGGYGGLAAMALPPGAGKMPRMRQPLSAQAKAAEELGLTLNSDGTVTLYHGTTPDGAAAIRKNSELRSVAEPDVYVTTAKEGTGYGTVSVPVRVDPRKLLLDDEFPDGRRDFRIPGRAVKVTLE